MAGKTLPGCDVLLNDIPRWLLKTRVGILCHQASVTSSLNHVIEELIKAGLKIRRIFSPQHGFFSEKQANMVESPDTYHPFFEIPITSLYSERRSPTEEELKDIDIMIIDLQDVGTRVYTYTTTMGLVMEACASYSKPVVILDRPNPIGTTIAEGNIVSDKFRSFVGRYRVPMRHGLTIGEFALWISKEEGLELEITVIKMKNWRGSFLFPNTGLQWVFPSPNMPTFETATVYPGMVLLEGTNISEGRGTALPFLIFGAPFVRPYELEEMKKIALDDYGVFLRPIFFEPVSDKWKGQNCGGFQIHIVEPRRFKPYSFGLFIISYLLRTYPDKFKWLPPPYEYEYKKLPIDILIGNREIRLAIERDEPIKDIEKLWHNELLEYLNKREDCRLYPD